MNNDINEQINDFTKKYCLLTDEQKRIIIAHLIFYFSEIARTCYVCAGNIENIASTNLCGFNEIIQTLSKQNIKLIDFRDQEIGYPDEVIFSVLKECFDQTKLSNEYFVSPIIRSFDEANY